MIETLRCLKRTAPIIRLWISFDLYVQRIAFSG